MAIRFELDPALTPELREEIVSLWTVVTNAGGAVGFVEPISRDDVIPIARAAFAGVEEGPDRLLAGYEGERLVAMLIFVDNRFVLKDHWCTLKRVMVHPDCQGRGYGVALMREAARLARQLGREALLVTVRGGLGLERFYAGLGYKEVGQLPGALRVGPGDDRDETLMWLPLR
jgi:GNAT superfamily N-acetyltransferase